MQSYIVKKIIIFLTSTEELFHLINILIKILFNQSVHDEWTVNIIFISLLNW